MFLKFWLTVLHAFLVEFLNLLNLILPEEIQRGDKLITQYKCSKALEGLKVSHPDQEHPSEIAHSLYISNIRTIDLEGFQASTKGSFHCFAFLIV